MLLSLLFTVCILLTLLLLVLLPLFLVYSFLSFGDVTPIAFLIFIGVLDFDLDFDFDFDFDLPFSFELLVFKLLIFVPCT